MKVTNLSHDKEMKLFFQLQSNNPKCFNTRPSKGMIATRKFEEVTVTQKPGQEAVDPVFRLKLTLVDKETTNSEALVMLESKEAVDCKKVSLKIVN